MRRRAPAASTCTADHNRTQDWAPPKERRAVESKYRRFSSFPKQLVTHPLFGVVLFLIIFPGRALVSRLQSLCAEGDLALCRDNNPQPVLTRQLTTGPTRTFVPNWRPDGRCGSSFPAPSGHLISVCNPFVKQHCCSQWGWCGSGPEYCAQAVKPPYNISGTAFHKFQADLQHRLSGKPDTFHSAYEEAQTRITRNYTSLVAALEDGRSLTTEQQEILQSAVVITHKQLEQFACCAPLQPPFIISASGHWTQDSRLTTEYLKQLISTYVYDPDQQVKKPFWKRIFGIRRLLGTSTPPAPERQHVGKGRFWASRQRVIPSPDADDSPSTAQHSAAGRPALKRQNAFKLDEQQSQALTQQLGLNSHVHSASGHDLLAATATEASSSADQTYELAAPDSPSQPLGGGVNLGNILAGAKALSKRQVLAGPKANSRAAGSQPDLHQPFNATTAYANITRCNTKRWLALHNAGDDFRQPRMTASGQTVHPPPLTTSGPVQDQGYKALPLTSFQGKIADGASRAQVLVVYHYYESLTTCEEDEEIQLIRSNFLSFLRFAVRENDGADYVISLGGRVNHSLLDLVPAYCNVRLRFVDNSTMHSDTCSFQRALADFGPALLQRYKYFVVINNGMRGPFARASEGHEQQHWTQPFIDKLDNHVKLVGPYLSCEIQVHVQGPFLVMDRVGVRYLLDIWSGCWSDHQTDIENGEVGLSQALLADGYNIASLQHEYAGLDFRQQPDRLQCKGRLPGANPTFCCDIPDPLQLHWVKYGGQVYRLGLLPPTLIRMVEDLTARTMELTPPLTPNGSRWRLPHPNWVQQQAAQQRVQPASWWQRTFGGPARFLGLVDDSLHGSEEPFQDSDWTLVKRVSAQLDSVPVEIQQAANHFPCSDKGTDPGLMGWIADAATRLSSGPISVQAASTDAKPVPLLMR